VTCIHRLSLLGVLLAAETCAPSGSFVRTDASFTAAARSAAPTLFVDQLPTRPYRAVGRIEVVLPESSTPADVQAAAAAKGRAVGCELLVASALHKKMSIVEPGEVGAILVHEFDPERHEVQHQAEKTTVFICGVYEAPAPVRTAARTAERSATLDRRAVEDPLAHQLRVRVDAGRADEGHAGDAASADDLLPHGRSIRITWQDTRS
jgi:hypothetical protein